MAVGRGDLETTTKLLSEKTDPFFLVSGDKDIAKASCALSELAAKNSKLKGRVRLFADQLLAGTNYGELSVQHKQIIDESVFPLACCQGNEECMRMLIDYGVSVTNKKVMTLAVDAATVSPQVYLGGSNGLHFLVKAGMPVNDVGFLRKLFAINARETILEILTSGREIDMEELDQVTNNFIRDIMPTGDWWGQRISANTIIQALLERGALIYQPDHSSYISNDSFIYYHNYMEGFEKHFTPANWALQKFSDPGVLEMFCMPDIWTGMGTALVQTLVGMGIPGLVNNMSGDGDDRVVKIILACQRGGSALIPSWSTNYWFSPSITFKFLHVGAGQQVLVLETFCKKLQALNVDKKIDVEQVKRSALEVVKQVRANKNRLPNYKTFERLVASNLATL